MQTTVGIFRSRSGAEQAVRGLVNRGIQRDCIILLSTESLEECAASESAEKKLEKIPTTDAEADGMGAGMGALLGGGVGASAGLAGGAAVASWLVPGVGTIFAIGLGAAAVLGLGGAVAGAKAGEVAEHKLDIGVPKDDVFLYRELLRRGRSLVIVNLESDDLARAAKDAIEEQGGEDVATARKELRPAA
jgi:hypothetical protein